jgi:hypothetical protein
VSSGFTAECGIHVTSTIAIYLAGSDLASEVERASRDATARG